jgi:hypothetical protein
MFSRLHQTVQQLSRASAIAVDLVVLATAFTLSLVIINLI